MGLGESIHLPIAIDWLVKNSNFPTFEEFCKNPNRWRNREEDLLESADASSLSFKKIVKRQRYQWKNEYFCDSLEQLQRIAKEEGFSPSHLEMSPQVNPLHGTSETGKVEIVIQFWPKEEFEKMGKVVMDV